MSLTKKLNLDTFAAENLGHDIFTELEKERTNWNVPQIKIDDCTEPTYQQQVLDCFSRIIALSLNLELPIGAFVRSILEMEKHLPMSAKVGLVKNILDEEKHQLAFENISKAYVVKPEDLKVANNYRKLLVKYDTHPLIKSRDLETIVFIPLQTALRYHGSQSLERLIGYISLDEYRHIQYGWELSHLIGINFNHDFEAELVNICNWAFAPLKDTPLNTDFWMRSVRQMKEDGESDLLRDLMAYGIAQAPFEISNSYY